MNALSPSVLIVEDDDAIRGLMATVLEESGCEVRTAGDGRAGLRILEDWSPDCICLDLQMPVMDGWAFREEQARRSGIRHIPVVVITGSYDADAGRLAGTQFLAKPFDLDDLVEAVRMAVAAAVPPPAAWAFGASL